MRPLDIHYAVAERWPLVTTGGLGEVAHSFPRALAARGHRLSILMPGYAILEGYFAREGIVPCPVEDDPSWLEAEIDGLRHLFHVTGPYHETVGGPYLDEASRPWPDLARRFGLFARACAERARREGVDILHLNDWHAAMAAAFLADGAGPRTVLTVHNFRYRGEIAPAELAALLAPLTVPTVPGEATPTLLGVGIAQAHVVHTVSPTYAREVLAHPSDPLAELLRRRPGGLTGIVNGLDAERWDPRRDPYLPRRYTARAALVAKPILRHDLARRWGFSRPDDPLAVFVGRLILDKGIDLLVALLQELDALGLNLAILGRGDPHYEAVLRELREPAGRIVARLDYDDGEAHRLLAAGDLLIMPSRHEPCGLVQLEALRYGTLPVVHASGGLVDTIRDLRRDAEGNGFVFTEPTAEDLVAAVRSALSCLRDPKIHEELVVRIMRERLGWQRRLPSYEALYRRVLAA